MNLDPGGKKGLVALLALLLPRDDMEGGRWSAAFIKYLTCALRVRVTIVLLARLHNTRARMDSAGMTLADGRVCGRGCTPSDLRPWSGLLPQTMRGMPLRFTAHRYATRCSAWR